MAILLAVFVLRRPIARVLVVASTGLIAGAIGTSRLVLGVHWPSDVLAGWALGSSVALAVTLSASLLSRSRGPYGTDAFRVSQLRV
jgi:undecaprenyl-diphosphatase